MYFKYSENHGRHLRLKIIFGSPIIVVINKIDQNPSFDVNRNHLQKKYNIKGFVKLSCSSLEGIEEFKELLQREILEIEFIESMWSQRWLNIKNNLVANTENFISYECYEGLCSDEGIHKEVTQDVIIDYLHDLGVILHFDDMALLDTFVLNPVWVTDAVYSIINDDKLAKDYGILKIKRLSEILNNKKVRYPKNKHNFIIEIMKKFQICYAINKYTILFPSLLSVQEPTIKLSGHLLEFEFSYGFFPKSIISKLIVKRHDEIDDSLMWRSGVVLKSKQYSARAFIKADEKEKKIYIKIEGEGNQKRDYFAIIRDTFHQIHNKFEKLGEKELVPLPNCDSSVSYKALLNCEKRKIPYYDAELDREFDVSELLNAIESPQARIEKNTYHINGDYIDGNKLEQKHSGAGDNVGRDKIIK